MAEAGKILVSVRIQPMNGFEEAQGRRKIARRSVLAPEEVGGGEDDKEIAQ